MWKAGRTNTMPNKAPSPARTQARPPGRPAGRRDVPSKPAANRPAKRIIVRIPRERFPGTDRNRALEHALHIHFAMQAGLGREEAVRLADAEVGPRTGRPAKARRR